MSGFTEGQGEPGLVSVVIPTRDRSALLREAIDSVIAQTYPHWEIVVVDDGSTDDTGEVVGEYSRRLGKERVRCVHQGRLGGQAARNRGTRESRGEFVQYLDSDDMLTPDKLAAHKAAIETSGLLAAYGDLLRLDGERLERAELPSGLDRRPISRALRGAHVSPMLMLVRREALRAAGPWDEGLEVIQDIDYSYRLWASGASAALSRTGGYIWRSHAGPRVGDVMLSDRRLHAWDRVLRNLEEMLSANGTLEGHRADLACRYYLSALTPADGVPAIREAWLLRAAELGRPSRPLAGPALFQTIWAAAGARSASAVYQKLFRLKRLLRGLVKSL